MVCHGSWCTQKPETEQPTSLRCNYQRIKSIIPTKINKTIKHISGNVWQTKKISCQLSQHQIPTPKSPDELGLILASSRHSVKLLGSVPSLSSNWNPTLDLGWKHARGPLQIKLILDDITHDTIGSKVFLYNSEERQGIYSVKGYLYLLDSFP